MLFTIAKKEVQEIVREGRFKAAALFLLLLLSITFLLNYQDQRSVAREHEAATQAERHLWEHQPDKNPHGAAHFGVFVFKPVHALGVLDPGVDYYSGSTLYLEAHKRNSEVFSPVQDATSLARFGDMRPAFVLLYLFPLFIILLGYNLLTREWESKTLSLLVVQGAGSRIILAGKWMALSSFVLAFYLPLVLISAWFLHTLPGFAWSAFLAFSGLYLLYYIVFVNLTLLASYWGRTSGISLLSLLLFWMATTVLLPKLFSNRAEEKHPIPTGEEMAKNIAAMNKGRSSIHDLAGESYKQAIDSMLKQYGVDSVADLPVNMAGIRLELGEQQDTRNAESQYALVKNQLAGQQKTYNSGGLFSPFLAARTASMQLAGTDPWAHWAFTDSAERYRRLFVHRMNSAIAYESGKQEAFTEYKANGALWKEVPKFHYAVDDDVNAAVQPSLFSLLLWCGLSGAVLLVLSNRLNPLA